MTPNFFDPKRTQDVEMSCTWYKFIFYIRYLIPTMDANCNALGPLELTWRRPRPAVCSAQLRASLTTVSLVSTVTTCLVASRTSISIWFILTMGVSNRGTRGDLKGTHQYEVPSPGQDRLSSCSLLGRTSASGYSLMREPTSTSRWASSKLLFEHHWHQDMFFAICY